MGWWEDFQMTGQIDAEGLPALALHRKEIMESWALTPAKTLLKVLCHAKILPEGETTPDSQRCCKGCEGGTAVFFRRDEWDNFLMRLSAVFTSCSLKVKKKRKEE
jgi:hypothetical protein